MECYNETMDIFTTLSQYVEYEPYSYSTATSVSPEFIIVIVLLVLLFIILFVVSLYVVSSIFLGKVFKKAGLASWPAWVPVYNNWKLLEIGGQQGFWSVLMFIPIVNIASLVFVFIAMYHIGLKLGKSGSFLVLGIFLSLVWVIWLAIDSSRWNEAAPGAEPSIATGPLL